MHTDPELLSLLALGEHVGTADERDHAETCVTCAGEVSELQQVVTLGRSVGAETGLTTPRAAVWLRIRDELGLAAALEPVRAPDPFEQTVPTSTQRGRVDAFASELSAHARLMPIEASWSAASGRAELATDEQGRRLLQVALEAELPTAGLRQAWLVHRDNPELRQSLGILDGRFGLWTVAHSIDLHDFAILDISQQRTGETDHSGRTIVRGELTLVG